MANSPNEESVAIEINILKNSAGKNPLSHWLLNRPFFQDGPSGIRMVFNRILK
jgi:hypothetical protein